jgi:hypothetical protein
MKINKINILKIIWIILLCISFLKLDYFYYQILKWYIFWLSLYLVNIYYENKRENWMWNFWFIAIVYNPIAPIYFWRELWLIIDTITIIIYSINIKKEKQF